jgi:hypothetical protein
MTGQVVRMIHGPDRAVIAFRLSRRASEQLQNALGPDTRLVDLRESDGHERLVLAPPASPQLLGKLKRAFPDALVMVVELTDIEAGIRQGGPVTRSLDGGADTYAVARSLDQLAEMVSQAMAAPAQAPVAAELSAQAEDDLAVLLEEVLARREAARATPGRHRRDSGPSAEG